MWSTLLLFGLGLFILYVGRIMVRPVGQNEKPEKNRHNVKDDPVEKSRRDYPVIILGGSSSGLTAAAKLKAKNISFIGFERNAKAGDVWRSRYDRLCLHTINEVSNLPGYPFPSTFPTYIPKDSLASYYDSVSSYFNINYSTNVLSAKFDPAANKWTVKVCPSDSTSTDDFTEYTSDIFLVCTGQESVPYVPKISGEDEFTGTVIHSSKYKTGKDFAEKKVLVVGHGNSGTEIALDLWEQGAIPTITVSSPMAVVPRWLVQQFQTTFNLSYALPTWLADTLYQKVFTKYLIGDLKPYKVQVSMANIFTDLPVTKRPPVIDIGTLDLIRKRLLPVIPQKVKHFTKTGVVFNDGKEVVFDVVILATGYSKTSFATVLKDEPEILKAAVNQNGTVQGALEIEKKRVYFIGYNDKLGRLMEICYDMDKVIKDIREKRYIKMD